MTDVSHATDQERDLSEALTAVAGEAVDGAQAVLPVGQYVGVFHDPAADHRSDVGAARHSVRIGWLTWQLDDREMRGWALAHGEPLTPDAVPWTRDRWEQSMAESGVTDPDRLAAELLDRELVVQVQLGTAEAGGLARDCRIRSLLIGLGNTAEDPAAYALGTPEDGPLVLVTPLGYALWQWGHGCANLWDACEILAASNRRLGRTDATDIQVEQVLTKVLLVTQHLIAHGAAYLDASGD